MAMKVMAGCRVVDSIAGPLFKSNVGFVSVTGFAPGVYYLMMVRGLLPSKSIVMATLEGQMTGSDMYAIMASHTPGMPEEIIVTITREPFIPPGPSTLQIHDFNIVVYSTNDSTSS